MERQRLVSRPRGRPRSAAADDAILDAAMRLVREVGYDGVTIDAIAARAGVGKATVYRRFSTKEPLVAEAIARIVTRLRVPDTGTLEGDVLAVLRDNMTLYRDPATGPFFSSLVAAMARSEPIARVARAGFIAARREALRAVLERAARRGDLRRDLDLEVAIDVLFAPYFYRLLATGARIDDALTRTVLDLVLPGLKAAAPRRRARPTKSAPKTRTPGGRKR